METKTEDFISTCKPASDTWHARAGRVTSGA